MTCKMYMLFKKVNKMRTKNKIWSLLLFAIMLFLFSSISNSYAASNNWTVGDSYLWGSRVTANTLQQNLDNNFQNIVEMSALGDYHLEITSLDKQAKRYEAIATDSNQEYPEKGFTYAWDDFVDDYLIFNSFLNASYSYDLDINDTVLTSFKCELENIDEWFLLESEWISINEDFVEFFDASKVVDTVANYYEPTNITEITLGNFLGNISSYKIMNKNTLAKALQQFTDKNKWTFEFDLSGVINFPIFNSTLGRNQFFPYEEYIVTLELQYTKEGILDTFSSTIVTKKTENNIYSESSLEQIIALGGIKSVKANFALASFIGGLVFISIITTIIYRKKRN